MSDWLRDIFQGRPWWMNAMMVFSAYMAFFYVPWDIFWKPLDQDVEVWFGIMFTGWTAKVLAFPHWFVYAAGAYGFRRMRPWMSMWAPIYLAQVALGMLVWTVVEMGGLLGWLSGLLAAAPFAGLAFLLWSTRDHFLAERASLRTRYGEWALVTGASAGIGAAFARALAREGVSCVLSARREDRLVALAAELEKDHKVATRVVPADLSLADGADGLADAVSDIVVSILVNNAGIGHAGRFDKLDGDRLRALVQVNCLAPVILTHRLLPRMREQGRGAIIFTGSIAGRQPLPLHSVYAATKAFDQLLGEALFVEQREAGIDVLVLEPGPTATEFQEVAGETAHGGEPPADVVELALAALGRQPSVVSGWFNWLRANAAVRLGSRPVVAYAARQVTAGRVPRELH